MAEETKQSLFDRFIRIFGGKEEGRLRDEIDNLDGQLKQKSSTVNNLTTKNMELNEKLEEQKQIQDMLEQTNRELTLKAHSLQTKCEEHQSECVSYKLKLQTLKEGDRSSAGRIEELEKEVNTNKKKISDFRRAEEEAESERQQEKRKILDLSESLQKVTSDEKSVRLEKECLENEVQNLKRQLDDVVSQLAKMKSDAEAKKEHANMVSSRINDLEQENQRLKGMNTELKSQNEKYRLENEKNIKTEVERHSMEREISDLKEILSTLEKNSTARENAQAERLRDETRKMEQDRKSALDELERRHAAERTDMQSQIEMFLKYLTDDKRFERDTVRTAIRELAQTNMVTNQILNAALATYQRNIRPQGTRRAANIKPLSSDD